MPHELRERNGPQHKRGSTMRIVETGMAGVIALASQFLVVAAVLI